MSHSLTFGALVRKSGATPDQVRRLINTNRIRPIGRAAHCYIFAPEAIEQIRCELNRKRATTCS